MKSTRLFALFITVAILAGLLPGVVTVRASADSDQTDTGIVVNKTATANENGSYTVTLEAYATGSKVISQEKKDVPTDIVLVLDQSGSMGHCINCGTEFQNGSWNSSAPYCSYTAVGQANDVPYSSTVEYFYKPYSGYDYYLKAVYCDGTNGRNHNGHNGWYTSSDYMLHGNQQLTTDILYKGVPHEHRLDALKYALNNFYTSVSEKATTEVNHRIAIVGFASNSSTYKNTELLTGVTLSDGSRPSNGSSYYYYPTFSKINGIQFGNISQTQYQNSLQDISTDGGKSSVQNAINALTAHGGTNTDDGLTMAENIFNTYTVPNDDDGNPTRNRVVVLFTDGDTDSDRTTTIQTAYSLKKTYNATVYTVGIFDGANGKPVSSWNDVSNANKFMHLISSNFENANTWYPNASTNTYPVDGSSYYLSASDTESLNSIFKQISGKIDVSSSVTELDENTTIKDVVSQQFTFPENTSEIKVYTQDSDGSTSDWKNRELFKDAVISIDSESRSISVSNFSFKDNWCGNEDNLGTTSFHDGKKLIIEFVVTPRDGFLGGNDVYTNAGAGIYENANATKPVVNFNQPQVNVPIQNITITKADKNVYLLEDLTAAQIRNGVSVKVGDVELSLDPAAVNYGLADWQTKYVTINLSIVDENNQSVSDLNALTSDKTYSISVSVAPNTPNPVSNEGKVALEKTGSDYFKINVFKPVLTFKDGTVDYGSAINKTNYFSDKTQKSYESDNYVSTKLKWMHESTDSADVTMLGTVPALTKTYQYDTTLSKVDAAGKVVSKDFVGVDVAVKIRSTDVTQYVTFAHDACTSTDCTWDTDNGDFEFLLHVINKCADLTIQKQGIQRIDNDETNEVQSVIFHIKGKTNGIEMDVVIHGNSQKVIKDLPIDTYTVTEKTDWSWRYTPDTLFQEITLDAGAANSLTFTNTRTNPYWLNGGNYAHNVFGN